MPSIEHFGRICETCGPGLEDVQLLRKKRTRASIIKSTVRANVAEGKTTLYESAVVVAAPGD